MEALNPFRKLREKFAEPEKLSLIHILILDRGKLFANLDRVGNYSFKETGMEFLHNNHLRSPERKKDKKKYYEILVRREARINEPAN